MNRHEYAALARGTVSVIVGFLPFAVLGYFGSWWLAGGLFAAGVGAAGMWLTRLPEGPRP